MFLNNQRRFCKLVQNNKQKHSGKTYEHSKFHRTNSPVCTNCSRHYHYKYIQPVSKNKNASNYFQKCCVTFRITRHQYNHRQRKINEEHNPKQWAVTKCSESILKISYFFRDISVPNKHELT